MIFSSVEFIYLFLPPVLGVFLLFRKLRLENAIIWWLILASLTFYLIWSPIHLLLLLGSIGTNYVLHRELLRASSKAVLFFGICLNLLVLGIFKYADFLILSFTGVTGYDVPELGLILPLAISFFTFQQISFLCDTWRGHISSCDFKRYVLYVAFFPQLIAGPIVLQKDTIPQFNLASIDKRYAIKFVTGITLFSIGLFKKIVLADSIAPVANSVFALVDAGSVVGTTDAWIGALAYTFQIYFDFSGYCDMAIGLALMFGIRLPINFNSPYKSLSIVEFWRRWHISLSRFLRDYLYIPLGGNRSGIAGAKGNLIITMLLGGLWHGAGWNFVIWGGLHGAFLIVNHAWSASVMPNRARLVLSPLIYVMVSWLITMFCVVVAWVFFRAETFSGALIMLHAMSGLALEPSMPVLQQVETVSVTTLYLLLAMTLVVVVLPNSIEFTRNYNPVLKIRSELKDNRSLFPAAVWIPTTRWSAAVSAVCLVAIYQIYRINDLTEFIYFNF